MNDNMNPFIQSFKLKVIEVYSEQTFANKNDIQEGIITRFKKEISSYYTEKQEKTSVYEIPYVENVLFKELNSIGRDILLYIIYNLKPNEDTINLKTDKVCKEMNISRPTFSRGINSLKDIALICNKEQSIYWINPYFIFRGNRINYYKKNCADCLEIVAKINEKS